MEGRSVEEEWKRYNLEGKDRGGENRKGKRRKKE